MKEKIKETLKRIIINTVNFILTVFVLVCIFFTLVSILT